MFLHEAVFIRYQVKQFKNSNFFPLIANININAMIYNSSCRLPNSGYIGLKKGGERGRKYNHTCCFSSRLFFCFCSYQAQAFLITSGMTVRWRVCLLLYLFPVGFKTSRALQALTRNTKAAKQLVLRSNTPELQTGNHVLGQVQYKDCFRVPHLTIQEWHQSVI